jgi:homoserine O-acetyltransferase
MDLFDLTTESLTDLRLVSSHNPDIMPSNPRTPTPAPHLSSLARGLAPLVDTPILILGVQSDILFPVEQQREIADALRMAGNDQVVYYELGGVWGHDTFLCAVLLLFSNHTF